MKCEIKPVGFAEAIGVSYAGVIRCDFDVLEANVGSASRHGPLSCSWNLSLRLDDGQWLAFKIYNYKGKTSPEKNEMWHVGSMHENDDAIFSFLEKVLRCDVIIRN